MDNQLLQEINITLGAGFQQLAASLRRLERNFGQYGQQANRAGQQTHRTNQRMQQTTRNANQAGQAVRRMGGGISNIQAGLVQLSNYLLILNQRITNTFANMTKRFTNAEDAMTQLKITLGLGGKTSVIDPKGFAAFEESTQLINKLAATTQFTKKEVANAFTELVQSGRNLQESNKLIASTLQMATASGGMIDLKEATEVATLSIGTLGAKVEEVPDVLNMLVRLSNKTKIGFTDLRGVMESLGSSFVNLGDEGVKRSTALMVMAAALRTLGDKGKGAGHHVGQFFRTLTGIQKVLARGKLRFEGGLFGKGRVNLKRESLARLFGVDRMSEEELVRATDRVVKIGPNYIKRLQDEFMKRQFLRPLGGGKYGKIESVELMKNIARAFIRLRKEAGEGGAEHIVATAFGQEAGVKMLQAIIRFADQAGVGIEGAADHFANSMKVMMTNEKDLMRATEESQKTLSYRLKVLDSAYDNLSNTIYKHDLVNKDAVDTHKEIVSAVGVLMEKNEGLASSVALLGRGLQFLSGVGANVGFTLVAAATFSHGLTMSLRGTSVAAAGLSGTLRAFGTMFLLPTLTVVLQFTGALAVLSLGLLATVRYFGGENLTTAQAFANVLERIKNAAKAAGGMMNLVFSKEYGDKGVFANLKRFYELREKMVAERTRVSSQDNLAHITTRMKELKEQMRMLPVASIGGHLRELKALEKEHAAAVKGTSDRYNILDREMSKLKGTLGKSGYEGLYSFVGNEQVVLAIGQVIDAVRELASGLMIIAESALGPMLMGIGVAFRVAGMAIKAVLAPFKFIAKMMGLASDEASALRLVLKGVGVVIGTLIGVLIARKSILLFRIALGGLRHTALSVRQSFHGLAQAAIRSNNAIAISTARNTRISSIFLGSLQGALIRTQAAANTFGGVFTMIGLLLSYFGHDTIGNIVMGIGLLVPAIWSAVPALMAVQRASMVWFATIAAISIGILGLLYALGMLEGFKMASVTGGDMGLGSTPTGEVSGDKTSAQATAAIDRLYPAQSGVQPGAYATSDIPTYAAPVQNTRAVSQVTNDHRVTYHVNRQIVNTKGDPVEFAKSTARLGGKTVGSDYSMSRD